ncbi:MAG: hypothetical protein NZL93_01515, partial [Chthoniobacterales bacterium]|nr:hypothetical protein [Chthoniobacterales bacterium]
DIALDTFPYNGTTTTLEALWMGVPVITLAGSDHRSRVGLSMLSSLQLNDLIAYSPEEYIRKAINLASDLSLLSSFKSSLRNTLLKSTLLNPKEFIVHFEELLLSLLPES